MGSTHKLFWAILFLWVAFISFTSFTGCSVESPSAPVTQTVPTLEWKADSLFVFLQDGGPKDIWYLQWKKDQKVTDDRRCLPWWSKAVKIQRHGRVAFLVRAEEDQPLSDSGWLNLSLYIDLAGAATMYKQVLADSLRGRVEPDGIILVPAGNYPQ